MKTILFAVLRRGFGRIRETERQTFREKITRKRSPVETNGGSDLK